MADIEEKNPKDVNYARTNHEKQEKPQEVGEFSNGKIDTPYRTSTLDGGGIGLPNQVNSVNIE
jgi:hypothetical protein